MRPGELNRQSALTSSKRYIIHPAIFCCRTGSARLPHAHPYPIRASANGESLALAHPVSRDCRSPSGARLCRDDRPCDPRRTPAARNDPINSSGAAEQIGRAGQCGAVLAWSKPFSTCLRPSRVRRTTPSTLTPGTSATMKPNLGEWERRRSMRQQAIFASISRCS
jgi:hypothetical protein